MAGGKPLQILRISSLVNQGINPNLPYNHMFSLPAKQFFAICELSRSAYVYAGRQGAPYHHKE